MTYILLELTYVFEANRSQNKHIYKVYRKVYLER